MNRKCKQGSQGEDAERVGKGEVDLIGDSDLGVPTWAFPMPVHLLCPGALPFTVTSNFLPYVVRCSLLHRLWTSAANTNDAEILGVLALDCRCEV